MSTTWSRISELALAALIVINLFELALFLKIRGDAGLYSSVEFFPLPSGYSADKSFIVPRTAPCFLIRLSSDGCPYCRLDEGQYARLVEQAQRSRCEAMILAPKVGQIKPGASSGAIVQLQYVDMKFGRVLNPRVTPETILLDGRGRLIWYWEGSINDGALSKGLDALARLR
jgi:hypothetical protein